METLIHDLRFGARMLLKNPGFASVAVLTLALGIGANTAIFSVVNAVLLRPLKYKEPDRLVWWWEQQPQLARAPFSPGDFVDFQTQNQTFEQVAGIRDMLLTLTGEGTPEPLRGEIVSANYFDMLGVAPALGRVLQADDGQKGAPRVAILSHPLWQRRFGGDARVIGQSLRISGEDVTVIGVMPPDFQAPAERAEIWVNPHATVPDFVFTERNEQWLQTHGSHFLKVMGRLKAGVTRQQAQADIDAIFDRIHQQYPQTANHTVRLVPLHERITGQLRSALLIVFGAVGLVLLIACANVANLMLARATGRSREMAIRAALGASRWRTIRQLFTESLLIALVGGTVGVLLAAWGVRLLVSLSPADTPRLNEIGLDLPVLAFTLAASLLTGILFGFAPVLFASRIDINETLKEGTRSVSGGGARHHLRNGLVMAEVALALIVLVGAGLLVRSFMRLQAVDPGFNPDHLLTMRVGLIAPQYGKPGVRLQFLKALGPKLEAIPGVESVAIGTDLPIAGTNSSSNPTVEGRAPNKEGEELIAGMHMVSAGYFNALGIPLLKGREFNDRDNEDAPPVAVVNETMARTLWPDQDPIGKHFTFDSPKSPNFRWTEVVGLAADVKHDGLNVESGMHAYQPNLQNPWPFDTIALRSRLDDAALLAAAQQAIQTLDPNEPVFETRAMSKIMSEAVAERRLTLALSSLFAIVALLLAGIGIYGVIAYSVTQRTHEIGLRLALGAQRTDILRLVLKHGALLAVTGVGVGVAGALAATRLMQSLLFEVSATDPLTFLSIAVLIICVALLACYLPARRATKVDPMVALRYE
ncbi:MAG TPA: ABC transporter permease [Blastocatellia bacterium]|nr:ABC transporter permease [Blastocatellia bacterium]